MSFNTRAGTAVGASSGAVAAFHGAVLAAEVAVAAERRDGVVAVRNVAVVGAVVVVESLLFVAASFSFEEAFDAPRIVLRVPARSTLG